MTLGFDGLTVSSRRKLDQDLKLGETYNVLCAYSIFSPIARSNSVEQNTERAVKKITLMAMSGASRILAAGVIVAALFF